MDKIKAIEILKDLQSEIEDNWDKEQYQKEINDNVEALDVAINALNTSNIVGKLTIGNDKYIPNNIHAYQCCVMKLLANVISVPIFSPKLL